MPRPIARDAVPAQEGVSSLRRAFLLLDAFTTDEKWLTVRELARRTGVPRSTTHRLVAELLAWGALERGRSGVGLGSKLFELGMLMPGPAGVRDAALPFAHNLNEVTGLTVNLAVREGAEIVYVEKITTRSLRVPHSRLGGRASLHATALGKAILAFSAGHDLERLLAEPLPAVTAKTITDVRELRRQLAEIRLSKVAYDLEESRPGLFCVAAPILDAKGTAVAAVSVTGATALAEAERYAPAIRMSALAIERVLRPL